MADLPSCPSCNTPLALFTPREAEAHVNACLDCEDKNRQRQSTDDNPSCGVCGRDLSLLTESAREEHANRCADSVLPLPPLPPPASTSTATRGRRRGNSNTTTGRNGQNRESEMKGDARVEHLLEMLGLQRYARKFAAEEIDLVALRLLTDDDLAALAIPEAARRRIADAMHSVPILAQLQRAKTQQKQNTKQNMQNNRQDEALDQENEVDNDNRSAEQQDIVQTQQFPESRLNTRMQRTAANALLDDDDDDDDEVYAPTPLPVKEPVMSKKWNEPNNNLGPSDKRYESSNAHEDDSCSNPPITSQERFSPDPLVLDNSELQPVENNANPPQIQHSGSESRPLERIVTPVRMLEKSDDKNISSSEISSASLASDLGDLDRVVTSQSQISVEKMLKKWRRRLIDRERQRHRREMERIEHDYKSALRGALVKSTQCGRDDGNGATDDVHRIRKDRNEDRAQVYIQMNRENFDSGKRDAVDWPAGMDTKLANGNRDYDDDDDEYIHGAVIEGGVDVNEGIIDLTQDRRGASEKENVDIAREENVLVISSGSLPQPDDNSSQEDRPNITVSTTGHESVDLLLGLRKQDSTNTTNNGTAAPGQNAVASPTSSSSCPSPPPIDFSRLSQMIAQRRDPKAVNDKSDKEKNRRREKDGQNGRRNMVDDVSSRLNRAGTKIKAKGGRKYNDNNEDSDFEDRNIVTNLKQATSSLGAISTQRMMNESSVASAVDSDKDKDESCNDILDLVDGAYTANGDLRPENEFNMNIEITRNAGYENNNDEEDTETQSRLKKKRKGGGRKKATDEDVISAIRGDDKLYEDVLMMRSVAFGQFSECMRAKDVKISKNGLHEFLLRQGVAFKSDAPVTTQSQQYLRSLNSDPRNPSD